MTVSNAPISHSKKQGPDRIMAYLEQVTAHSDYPSCVFLPSVMNLARSLKCAPLEVHDALRRLTKRGYKFLLLGLDSPVTLRYLG